MIWEMRVLIFTESLWPFGGGGELATYLFVRQLVKHDVGVRVVLRRGYYIDKWKGLEIYNIRCLGYGKHSVLTHESRKLIEKLSKWTDVAYFTTGLFNIIPLIRSLGIPTVVHIHSYFPVCPVGHLYNFIHGNVCLSHIRSCYKCVLVYESMRRSKLEAVASYIANSVFGIKFLKHVLDSDALVFVSETQQRLFLEYSKYLYRHLPKNYIIYNPLPNVRNLPIEGDNVGFLGGLDPIKGFNILLMAWLQLYRKFEKSKLMMAMTLGLPDPIERIGVVRYPRLRDSELDAFHTRCRVITVPSLSPEPSPYATIETLLRGRLLIASKIGGIPELLGNAPGVRLVPPGDVDSLVDGLDWALSMDRADAIEFGLKNHEYILKKFSNERSARELLKVFESVL